MMSTVRVRPWLFPEPQTNTDMPRLRSTELPALRLHLPRTFNLPFATHFPVSSGSGSIHNMYLSHWAGTVISSCQYLIFQVWIVTDKSSQSACGIYGHEHNPLGMFENVAVADRGRSCITPYSTFLSRPPSVRPCARRLSRSCLRTSTARGSSPRPAPKVRLPLQGVRV